VVTRAVARRALRYWTADPRYLSAMLAAVGMSALLVLLAGAVVGTPAAVALAAAPLMAGTIGWGRHNDVAYDGSAFWMHVVAAVPGWTDRAGRALATLVWAVPATVVVGVVGAWLGGRPDLAPAAVGAGLGVLAIGLGVSAVSSALLVYPVPEAGANPYSAQAGALGAVLVAQLVTSAATLVLSLPVLLVLALALWWEPGLAWVVLVLGVLLGASMLWLGVRLGGALLERRAPRLLTRLG
jgi:ABC-2 type transport system permease protein